MNTKQNQKKVKITVSFTRHELQAIDAASAKLGISRTEHVHYAVIFTSVQLLQSAGK